MLSTKSLGTASSGIAGYYEHLAADDYYQAGGEPPGQWHGRLSGALGLAGNVRAGQLRQLFEGYDPSTGKALASNAGESHKAGWDLTFSAPKSVSVAWALGHAALQEQIADAHAQAVKAGLDYLERNAFASRDRNGRAPLKGIIAATYQHGTSRELDPQLHTHCAVANIGLREDGTVCAVDFDSRWKMAAGAVYRAELAHRLQQLGLDIEQGSKSFRLAAIPETLCQTFSKRRRQIAEYLQQTGFDSAKSADIAALATRKAKELANREILQENWQREAEMTGYSQGQIQAMLAPTASAFTTQKMIPAVNVADIVASLTQNEAVFSRQQLEAAIATAAQGIASATEIPLLVQQAIESGIRSNEPQGLVRLAEAAHHHDSRRQTIRYTTREMLAIEREAIAGAVTRKNERQHTVQVADELLDGLSAEQASAVRHITQDAGAVKCVRGLAGTGKSHMLGRALQAWEAAGLQVIGAALAGKAADGLQAGSGIASQTLHSLLAEIEQEQRILDDKTVVVIDEAGMIGTRQMHKLLGHIHEAGAKVVLVGDPKQLQPIDAGGVFRKLSEELGFAGLEEIRRQKNQNDIAMIKTLISGDAQSAIEQLAASGQLRIERDDMAATAMVEDWLMQRDPQRPGESVMLAGTKSDVKKLNLLARQRLLALGRLHSEITIQTEGGEKDFAIGDRILFTRNSRALGVRNGMLGTMENWRMRPGSGAMELTLRLDDGEVIRFDPAEYSHVDHGYAISTHKAQGVTCDRVNVLLSESMTDQEWSYVAMSRHRQRLRVFVPETMEEDLSLALGRSRQKALASDYAVATEPTPKRSSRAHEIEPAC